MEYVYSFEFMTDDCSLYENDFSVCSASDADETLVCMAIIERELDILCHNNTDDAYSIYEKRMSWAGIEKSFANTVECGFSYKKIFAKLAHCVKTFANNDYSKVRVRFLRTPVQSIEPVTFYQLGNERPGV